VGRTALRISAAQRSEERALAQRPAWVTACVAPLPSAAAFRDGNLCSGSQRKWGNKGTELRAAPASQLGSGLGLTGFGFAAGEAKAKSHQVSFEKDFLLFCRKNKTSRFSHGRNTRRFLFMSMTTDTYVKCLLFSHLKNPSRPPPPPRSCKSDKTNVNKSQFLVHWGRNSAESLQQLRSVFCTCFATTDKHTTQSQSPCTASQVKTNRRKQKETHKPQVSSHRSLPS